MANNVPPAPPPYQPMTPGNNPYEFITNSPTTPKKSLLGGSKKQRILVVAVLGVVLLTVIIVVASLLSSSGGGQKQEYQTMLQQHAELVRVSKIGTEKARGTAAKNLAITAHLSLTSSQASLTSLAKKGGANTDAKIIASGKDAATDTKLDQAEQSNRFDETFVTVMKELLADYQKTLKSLHEQSTNAETKKTLQQAYNNAVQLVSEEKKE